MDTKTIVIIMAGGLGKRMNSDLPKVLHKIDKLPMLFRVIVQARAIKPYKILVVVGKYRSIIEATLMEYTNLNDIEFIDQSEPLGTGHAILSCRPYLQQYTGTGMKVLVLSGDVPLMQSNTMIEMLKCNEIKIMITSLDNPKGYGRIYESENQFQRIIEEKDCTDDQRLITTVNCGIYSFDIDILCKYLPYITNNNAQKEYYLTDIIEIIKNSENIIIGVYNIPINKQLEIIGVNTKEQLEELTKLLMLI